MLMSLSKHKQGIKSAVWFQVEIQEMTRPHDGDIVIRSVGFGETFQLGKHPQGTEVKAITYSAMQINKRPNFAEVFVIIDI
jgi:SHS2 domain-containing protein